MSDLQAIWGGETAKDYPQLDANITCEIVVVGGGIAGVLTAFLLSERGHDVVLLEAEKLFSGATHNTTATITSQHGLIYKDIITKYGASFARKFYESQEEGISRYKDLIEKYQINCDFKELNGYLYTIGDTQNLQEEYDALLKIGANVKYVTSIDNFPLSVNGAILQGGEAQFNPIKFLLGLPINYKIYEHTRALNCDCKNGMVFTDKACVTANKIVIASNFPIVNIPGFVFTKQYQSMTYATAFSNVEDICGIFNDDKDDGFTLRSYNDYLIVGGVDHRTGRKPPSDAFAKIAAYAKKLFPSCKVEKSWLSEDSSTYDDIPLVGALQNGNDGVLIITGFCKWGMSSAIISAQIIADIIDNKSNKYAKLFSLKRHYLVKNILSFAVGGAITLSSLAKSYLKSPLKSVAKLQKGDGGIFIIDGKKRAVYRDDSGELHIISGHCPHLGCAINFNKEALTWDCECHGTRLTVDGKIIAAPTVKDGVLR